MEILEYNGTKGFCANTFLIVNDNKDTICIDPGDDSGDFEIFIKNKGLRITHILLTHGHADHIAGIYNVQKIFPKVITYINEKDSSFLFDETLNLYYSIKNKSSLTFFDKKCDLIEISGDELLNVNGYKIQAIFTPFHTPGSTCYYIKELKCLFSGDTIFADGVGRTDLPGGCQHLMVSSLNKLRVLPPNTYVYPGHDKNCLLYNATFLY